MTANHVHGIRFREKAMRAEYADAPQAAGSRLPSAGHQRVRVQSPSVLGKALFMAPALSRYRHDDGLKL